jgi:uncharacterized small protein (DUF1192 family)
MEAAEGVPKMDMSKYDTHNLKSAVDLDAYAVRDEAYRRSALLCKKIARLNAQLITLNAENEECGRAIHAAYQFIGSNPGIADQTTQNPNERTV